MVKTTVKVSRRMKVQMLSARILHWVSDGVGEFSRSEDRIS